MNHAALLLAGAALLQAENYDTANPHDQAAQLAERLKSGAVKLPFDAKNGYLPALLKQFHISISSQVLVFSKTSLQASRISRQAPRAVYFNDDTYVGWVKPSVQFGEVMEITSVDPKVGTIFYSMNQQETATPEIKRHDECLHCHVSPQTEGVPGLFVRSVFPDSEGFAVLTRGSFLSDHRSPLSKRWGGWYVSGTHGGQRHMGNSHLPGRGLSGQLDIEAGANQRDLNAFVNTEPYLSPHSDIVALMVLEHQARAQNLIFRSQKDSSAADALADYLLFTDEAALTAPVAGVSGFAAEFAARGPFDGQGRSLREFDLKTRMFRYPLSYMIYSASFDNIPIETRKRVYKRIFAALDGTPALEILRATKNIRPERGKILKL